MKTTIRMMTVVAVSIPLVACADLSRKIQGLWKVETQHPTYEETTRQLFKKMGLGDEEVQAMVAAMPKMKDLQQIFEITATEFRQTSKSQGVFGSGGGSLSVKYKLDGDRLVLRMPGLENIGTEEANPMPSYYTVKVKGDTMVMTTNPMAYLGGKPITYTLKRKTKADVRKASAGGR